MIGILSDSHDNVPAVRRAVELFKDAGCDLVVHAGDFVAPFAAKILVDAKCPVKAVFGNCDGEKKGLVAALEPFGAIRDAPYIFAYRGRHILITHLDMPVEGYAVQKKWDVIIFGHTHKPEIRESGSRDKPSRRKRPPEQSPRLRPPSTLIINPGEAGGWLTGRSTIALFDPEKGTADIIDI
jgi:putative phosphoesterase